jgi:hypothetical protein
VASKRMATLLCSLEYGQYGDRRDVPRFLHRAEPKEKLANVSPPGRAIRLKAKSCRLPTPAR